jgi:hypothetical protein
MIERLHHCRAGVCKVNIAHHGKNDCCIWPLKTARRKRVNRNKILRVSSAPQHPTAASYTGKTGFRLVTCATAFVSRASFGRHPSYSARV